MTKRWPDEPKIELRQQLPQTLEAPDPSQGQFSYHNILQVGSQVIGQTRHRKPQCIRKVALCSIGIRQSSKGPPFVAVPNRRETGDFEYDNTKARNLFAIGVARRAAEYWSLEKARNYQNFLLNLIEHTAVEHKADLLVINEYAFPSFVSLPTNGEQAKKLPKELEEENFLARVRAQCQKYKIHVFAGTLNNCSFIEDFLPSLYGYSYGYFVYPDHKPVKIFKHEHSINVLPDVEIKLEGFTEYDKSVTLRACRTEFGDIGFLVCADFISMASNVMLEEADSAKKDIAAIFCPAMDWSKQAYVKQRAQSRAHHARQVIGFVNSLDCAVSHLRGGRISPTDVRDFAHGIYVGPPQGGSAGEIVETRIITPVDFRLDDRLFEGSTAKDIDKYSSFRALVSFANIDFERARARRQRSAGRKIRDQR